MSADGMQPKQYACG